MTQDEVQYPLEGSLGATLFDASRDYLRDHFDQLNPGFPTSEPPTLPHRILSDLEHYLELQRELTEVFPRRDRGERTFRKVPSGRMFGKFDYYAPDEGLFIGTYIPPFTSESTVLNLLFLEEPGDPLGQRLVELGFPVPIREPTVLVGRPDLEEGAMLLYAPGPPGLAELVYRICTHDGQIVVVLSAVRPPQPRFGQLVEAYRRTFDWEGTLVFDDTAALQRDEGEIRPPGSRIHREL